MGVRFTTAAHRQFIRDHGERLTYYAALPCGCGSTPDPARADVNCPLCGGSGRRYQDGKELRGIITDIHREKSLLEAGIAHSGDCVLGLGPRERIIFADWDLVEMPFWVGGSAVWGDIIRRNPEGPDDFLPHVVKTMQVCESVNPETNEVTAYTLGTHFVVSGNTLSWIDGQPQPDPDTFYVVRYTALLQWVAFLPPSDRYDAGRSIGQKVLLRKRHIALRGEYA